MVIFNIWFRRTVGMSHDLFNNFHPLDPKVLPTCISSMHASACLFSSPGNIPLPVPKFISLSPGNIPLPVPKFSGVLDGSEFDYNSHCPQFLKSVSSHFFFFFLTFSRLFLFFISSNCFPKSLYFLSPLQTTRCAL